MNTQKITRIEFEGTGTIIEMVQHPSTHAICEYCNSKVPFPFMRKVNDLPCCIDCMANLCDDTLMRTPEDTRLELWDVLFNAGFEPAAEMVFSSLNEENQRKINKEQNR